MAKEQKSYKGLAIGAIVLAVLFLIGWSAFPVENTVTVEHNNTVVKEVPVNVTQTEVVADASEYLQIAMDESMKDYLDNYDGDYKESEISWFRDFDYVNSHDWDIKFLKDGDYKVEFSNKIAYKQADESRETESFDFVVKYDAKDNEFDISY